MRTRQRRETRIAINVWSRGTLYAEPADKKFYRMQGVRVSSARIELQRMLCIARGLRMGVRKSGGGQVANWTEQELRTTVRAYLRMLEMERNSTPFSKADVRRKLRKGALKARSEPSIEFRMRNISAVLAEHGRPIIKGYLPAANVGEANRQALWSFVQEEDEKLGRSGSQVPLAFATASTSRRPEARPPVIYFNIGWMANYAGATSADLTEGAHGYLKEHAHGAEALNFRPTAAGTVQGYRPPGTRQRVGIEALGALPSATSVSGVLVVWLAKEPASKRTLIVGWYRNATVHREAIELAAEVNGERISYTAEAAEAEATRVPR